MRRTLKIKTRLLLTVGFVAAMLAASSGVALWRLSAVEESVQRVVRGDSRLAGVMAQFVLHVGDLTQHERAYLANTARSRPADSELLAWKGAYTSANQRLTELDAVADGRSIAQSLRTTLRAYDTEFSALRSRIDADGIAKVDASGADGSRMREAFDRLERQASDQLVRYGDRWTPAGPKWMKTSTAATWASAPCWSSASCSSSPPCATSCTDRWPPKPTRWRASAIRSPSAT